ncbi:MAG: cytochrome c biogenesis protein [Actinomycetota bacterium]
MTAKLASLRPIAWLVSIGMLVGLVAIFTWVPTDCGMTVNGACFQGSIQRMFYVHVPSAWVSYLAFTIVLIGSFSYLRSGRDKWDHVAHASAEIGVVFTAITLVTGMIWGKPVWGAFWRWEPRLTTTLVMFLIYVGYLTFRSMATDTTRGSRIASVIGMAGFINVPIVHFSVQWYRGQHPLPVVVNPQEGAQLPVEMLITLLYMVALFSLMYATLLALRVRLGRLEAQVETLEAI